MPQQADRRAQRLKADAKKSHALSRLEAWRSGLGRSRVVFVPVVPVVPPQFDKVLNKVGGDEVLDKVLDKVQPRNPECRGLTEA